MQTIKFCYINVQWPPSSYALPKNSVYIETKVNISWQIVYWKKQDDLQESHTHEQKTNQYFETGTKYEYINCYTNDVWNYCFMICSYRHFMVWNW